MPAVPHAGARTDAKDGKGRSALHLAVGCSSKMAEKFLGLSPGLLDALDARGRTPLHYAAAKGAPQPRMACAAQKLPGCQDDTVCWVTCAVITFGGAKSGKVHF